MDKPVVVVGGGLAGLAAAIYLARGGRTVTVFERRRALGGRAVTHLRQGFRLNLGPHSVFKRGTAMAVYRELGVPVRGRVSRIDGLALFRDDVFRMPSTPWSLVANRLLSLRGRREAVRLALLLRKARIGDGAERTIGDWLDAHVEDEALRLTLTAMVRAASYSSDPEQRADLALVQLFRWLRGGIHVDEGWQKLVDSLHAKAVALGVNFITSARVVKIASDGRVRGVELGELEDSIPSGTQELRMPPPELRPESGALIPADTVILAVDPATATFLAGEAALAAGWVPPRNVQVATLDVALSSLPDPKVTFALDLEAPLMFSVHSAAAQVAPRGGAVLHATRFGAGAERELEQLLDSLQTGWRDLVVHRRYLPALTASHALVTPNWQRPQPTTGIQGLFIAGDWVHSDGLLSDAALGSAREAARTILGS